MARRSSNFIVVTITKAERALETKRDAFNEVRTMAGQRTELPVMAGTPEP